MNTKFSTLASKESINAAISGLKANGVDAQFVQTGTEAKQKALDILPKGTEVMTMTSVTLDTIGLSAEINDSGNYQSIRNKLMGMDWAKQGREMQKIGASPEWALGSVHAVTEDGKVLIASNTGSQLGAYAYGSAKVIWVVGAQKIVKDIDEGMKRIYEHSLVLESERAKKAYGVAGSAVNKILVVNKEVQPGRITMIIVNEVLGF